MTPATDELDHVLADRVVTAGDLAALPWTGRAVREAMRLYPAAHSIGRSNTHEEMLNGYRIPAGSAIVVSPWTIHRSPKIWADPQTFDPQRFDLPTGQVPGGHKYAWFPFGAGPHVCIGMQLAMLETPIVLATILQTYCLSTTLTSIPLQAISLHPADPLPVQIQLNSHASWKAQAGDRSRASLWRRLTAVGWEAVLEARPQNGGRTRATVGGGYRRSLTGSKPRSDPAPTGRRAWRVFT